MSGRKDSARDRLLMNSLLLLIIVIGVTVRWADLGARGLWWDELYSVVGSSGSPTLSALWDEWMVDDSHPPGFQVLMWLWFLAAPATEFWSRFPSALAGTGLLLYAAFGTRTILPLAGRAFLTALFACAYMPVFYAQEARQYSLLMLFSLIASEKALRLIREPNEARSWAAFVCACVAASYVHYFGLFLAGSWFLVLLFQRIHRRDKLGLKRWMVAGTAFTTLYVPGLMTLNHLIQTGNGGWQKRSTGMEFLNEAYASYFFQDAQYTTLLLISLGAIAAFSRWRWTPSVAPVVWPLVGLLLVAAAVAATANTQTPVLHVRYFLAFVPVLFLLLATVVARTSDGAPNGLKAICVLLPLLGLGSWYPDYRDSKKQGWKEATAWVQARATSDDAVGVLGPLSDKTAGELLADGRVNDFFYVRNHTFFEYYFDRMKADAPYSELSRFPNVRPEVDTEAARIANSKSRIFLLGGHHLRLNKGLKRYLSKRYTEHRVKKFKSTRVYVFEQRK